MKARLNERGFVDACYPNGLVWILCRSGCAVLRRTVQMVEMPSFSCYILDEERRVVHVERFDAATDNDALQMALAILNRQTEGRSVELRDGHSRRVYPPVAST